VLERKSLQELPYTAEFDAAVTIDAMENVPPEDWPTVLANLRRAVRPGGVLYLTVEEVSDQRIGRAFDALAARGLPALRGEIIEGDVAGYHYYPGRDRVMSWFEAAGLDVIDEDYSAEEDWGYRHFLLRALR
jgi:cyclopropane fatty-acyl-phospholipid synthase-like methyltransferase